MPEIFEFSFIFAGECYTDVVLTWSADRSPRRRSAGPGRDDGDGWACLEDEMGEVNDAVAMAGESSRERAIGWAVDVPDVLRMLEAVQAGRATADQVGAQLLRLAQMYSEKSGCCVECDDSIEVFEQAVRSARRARARFADAVGYPFMVTQNAIHSWDCYHFAGHRPPLPGRTVSEFVHRGYRYRDGNHVSRLSPEEATAWMDQRVGPKGAQKWRRCKTCQPALPGAWASQSSDVPTGGGGRRQ